MKKNGDPLSRIIEFAKTLEVHPHQLPQDFPRKVRRAIALRACEDDREILSLSGLFLATTSVSSLTVCVACWALVWKILDEHDDLQLLADSLPVWFL